MRNLIAFLRRFRIFLVFFTLQIIALSSYFSLVNYPRTKWFNSSAGFFAYFLNINNQLTKHFNLEAENKNLQKALKEANKNSFDNYITLATDKIRINDTVLKLQYNYIPATIINGTYTRKDNFFTLDKGENMGIKPNMGVVSSNGLVGIVYDVSQHYSVVKSVLNSAINIPVQIANVSAKGLLKWEVYTTSVKEIKLTGISNDIPVKKNSEVFTSGSSGIFPPNYSVGKIVAIQPIEGKPEWDLTVRLSNDLRTTQNVFVIDNVLKTEQETIENRAREEFKEQ
ncbi:MAG: rod shape-determining protein MreC [Lishizhenia sp.]